MNKNSPDKLKLSFGRIMVIGLGFLGINLVWPVFNSFVPLFLQAGNPEFEQSLIAAGREIPNIIGFGLSPSLAFFIMTWDNIFNVVVSPWAGLKSDQTWTKFGRRKPWMLIGVPIAAVALMMIPFAKSIFAIMVFIVITNFGMSIFRTPTVAWLGDLFPPEKRSQANGIINLMGGIGGAIALFGSGILFDRFGRTAPFIGGAFLLVLSEGIAIWRVKEPETISPAEDHETESSFFRKMRSVLKDQGKDTIFLLISIFFYFMAYETLQTGLTSFGVFTLGISPGLATAMTALFAGAFILFSVPSGMISMKLGRKRMMVIGLVAMVILFGAGFFLIQGVLLLGIILVLVGIAWAFVNVNSLPLVFDQGDDSHIGVFTGLYYVAAQGAAVAGPVLSGIVVEIFGNNYRLLWAVSAVYVLLAWLMISPVKSRANS